MTARVILAGNNLAAIYALDLLLDALPAENLLAIAPEGALHPGWQASLATHAGAQGVRTLMPPNVNAPDVLAEVEAHAPDLLLSIFYPQVFRDILGVLRGRFALNFHPSLLPRHRGTAPLIWAIAEGDAVTGLSVHHIDAGIDTGRLLVQHPMPIHPDDTGYSLHQKMAKLVRGTVANLVRTYLERGTIDSGVEQTGEVTSHSRRDPALNHVDWNWPGERVRNVVRALAPPLPGAYAQAGDESLVLARVVPTPRVARSAEKPPGMVELQRGGPPLVWASDGPVALAEWFDGSKTRLGEELSTTGRLVEGLVLT